VDRPGSKSGAEVWEGLSRNLGGPVLTDSDSRGCRGLMRDQAHAEVSAVRERTGDGSWSGGANQMSDPVVEAGSLSALIVLLTPGNTA